MTNRLSLAFAIAGLAAPASAWEFTPTPVCTLSHDTGTAQMTVTYDPSQNQPYAIAVGRDTPWPGEPAFAIRFDGPRGLTITTDRHALSRDGLEVSVTDTGFGNVLNGLEYNETATALLGDAAEPFPLTDAAEHVQAFRACTAAPLT